MTPDDLVERVADLVRYNADPIAIAEEAIAIIRPAALEEAAKVAEREWHRGDTNPAAAIRALIPDTIPSPRG